MISELVARSWAVLPEAWPVAATGRSDRTVTASQITDHRQVSVSRCPTPAIRAMIAAQRDDEATATCWIGTSHWPGASVPHKEIPATSESVSGMSSAAATAHAMLIHEEICCAR